MRRGVLVGLAAAALVAAVGVFGVWFLFLRGDEPPPVTLAGALDAAGVSTATPATSDSTNGASDAPAPAATASAEPKGFEGAWVIDTDGSFVGFRVREELVGIGATTAVGRTSVLEGGLEFDGSAITTVEVVADLRQLRSDDSRRDGQLRRQGLETDRFPEGRFVLVEPIEIGEAPAEGVAVEAVAVGELTLREITRRIEIPVEGVLTNGVVVVVGSLEIEFEDYEISRPTAPLVLSVEDRAVMELQLIFRRS
jgi:polyisoprenoid-binding protein YceI